MPEIRPGIWHWLAPHPDWKPDSDWLELVSSYAIYDGEQLLLFDPLGVPEAVVEHAAGGNSAIVLTCPWHERDAQALAERLGTPVYTPRPDEDSPDLSWLGSVDGHFFEAGERLPVGVHGFPGLGPNDLMLWVESRRTFVAGDTLIDRGNGFEVPLDWADEGRSEEILAGLRFLLELPIELVLTTHGGPTDRAALERALG